MYKLGIDIGSTTVKVVVLNDAHEILFSDYRRHYANIKETLQVLINEAKDKLGNVEVTPAITGSGGLALAEVIGVPFYTGSCLCFRGIAGLRASDGRRN